MPQGPERGGPGPVSAEPARTSPSWLGEHDPTTPTLGTAVPADELPPRTRGVIALVEENCTVCMLCARECPDWCIYIDSHKESVPAPNEGGRERQRNVLDRFAIDFSLCMYCGICVEVCPFDALFWAPDYAYAEGDLVDLVHERARLGEWVPSVPPPPAADPRAAPPREALDVARRTGDRG